MPTLHALLIAINEYPKHPLQGCINDLSNIKTALDAFCKAQNYDFQPFELKNKEATSDNIEKAYERFQAAKAGDTCLIYYSGHGYRIATEPGRWTDGDSFHEAIATYDADLPNGRGLVNKELAYLFWKNTRHSKDLHLVEIFDCCHSGGITRAIGEQQVQARTIPSERTPLPQKEYRGISEYIQNGTRLAPPVARRIQLAASTGKETSKEVDFNNHRQGAFTTAICEILKEENYDISYRELIEKASIRVKNSIFKFKSEWGDQSPQLDAERIEAETQAFTGKSMLNSEQYQIGFSKEKNCWKINAGAIQNLAKNAQIRIIETGEIVSLAQVFPNESFVKLSSNYDKNKQFKAEIIASLGNTLDVAFALDVNDSSKNKVNEAFAKIYDQQGKKPRFFNKIDNVAKAFFLIQCENNEFYLTTKEDEDTPLFLRCDEDDLDAFWDGVEKVAKWHIVKQLNNYTTRFTEKDVVINFSTFSGIDDYEKASDNFWKDNLTIDCNYELIAGKTKQPRFAIEVKNKSGKALWVSVVYLTADFSITNELLPNKKEIVDNGDLVRLSAGGEEKIWLSIPKSLRELNVLEAKEFIKVFVSTEELNTDNYNQNALPMDPALMRSATKGFNAVEEDNEELEETLVPDWRTYDIELKIKLPKASATIENGGIADVANHTIQTPNGFNAKISIEGLTDAQRSIGLPMLGQQLQEAECKPYFLTKGMATGASQSVLSIQTDNKDLINEENPIKIGLKEIADNETVIALAFDPTTGLYYPTGLENENGELEIFALPDPISDGQKSLGGSLKMFLQKVTLPIRKIIGNEITDDVLYRLRIPKIPADLAQPTEYEADRTTIATEIAKAKKIILFIHGIIGDTADQVRCLSRMKQQFDYDLLLAFDYENLDTSIQTIAEKLKTQLEKVGLGENHGKELHLVVHSMGGLVSRWFIERLGGDKIVSELVMLGTPNNGSEISKATTYVSLGVVSAINFACSYFAAPQQLRAVLSWGAKKSIGKLLYTLGQMSPSGEFIAELNKTGMPATVSYHIIAGDIFAINKNFKENGVVSTLFSLVEKGAGQLIYAKPNDIAVRVESILGVNGVADQAKFTLAVDHMNYFIDPNAVAQLEKILMKINKID
jgi:pimeloyl-ACP methyl ester carboxylesterase